MVYHLRRFAAPIALAALLLGALLWTWMHAPASGPTTAVQAVDPAAAAAESRVRELVAIGPDDARDLLYCAGVIAAALGKRATGPRPDLSEPRARAALLAHEGAAEMLRSGTRVEDMSELIDAQVLSAARDRAAGALRIPYLDCVERAVRIEEASAAARISQR